MDLNRIKFYIMFTLTAMLFIFLTIGGIIARRKQEKKARAEYERINAELEKDTARTDEEIYDRLYNAILADETDNVYMRVPATYSQSDLFDIAHTIDPFIGYTTQLTYTTSTQRDGDGPDIKDEYAGVNFSFEKTDDYCVYEAIAEGKDIPEKRPEAIEMKKVCETFLKENISDSMSDYEKELVIHDYIVNNCKYSFSDKNDKSEFRAYGALVNHKCVCEGYARAMYLLLRCCNIDARLVSGHTDHDSYVEDRQGKVVSGHMWNQVKIDGIWYNLDATWDDPVGGDDVLAHTYFNVDDSILSKDHKWESEEAERCTSMAANYYEKNGLYFKKDDSFKEYLKNELAKGPVDTVECAVKNPDLSDESMAFVFDYNGITTYKYSIGGVDNYEIVTIHFVY